LERRRPSHQGEERRGYQCPPGSDERPGKWGLSDIFRRLREIRSWKIHIGRKKEFERESFIVE
jgi:hypothetical protein